MKRLLAGVLFTGLFTFCASEAQGGTILPTCGTCGNHNTTWDLLLELIDDPNNTYRVTVTATYGSPVDFSYVNDVSIKLTAFENEYDGTTSVSGPAESGWSISPGGINSGGCSGTGNGFFCANSSGSGATPGGAGSQDIWIFTLHVNNTLANVTSSSGEFKVHFTNASNAFVGPLLSEPGVTYGPPTATTPEPATLLLFGTGLAAAATVLRRRKKS